LFAASEHYARPAGILPAPEAGHAVWGAQREALAARDAGEERTIVFNLCGHGHFDLSAYEDYRAGKLENYEHPKQEIEDSLAAVPEVS
jgi:tryptophan synthase beta chain